jgi:signal transduction histidine kinase
MTDALLKKFRQNLYEVFLNAREHSETELGVFACGQHYPQRNRLDFSIADLGIGIADRIWRSLELQLSDQDAVKWAMEGGTTRTGGRPGGLGLKLIREFIRLNKGRIIVISSTGWWRQKANEVDHDKLSHRFPGTVVTIEIDTSDQASYGLSSEPSPESVF